MEYLKAFLVGGAICAVGQLLLDKTKLTPARILVCFVVLGVILGACGVYKPLVDFAGAGRDCAADGLRLQPRQGRKTGGAGGRMARRAHRRTESRGGRHFGSNIFRLSRGSALQAEG